MIKVSVIYIVVDTDRFHFLEKESKKVNSDDRAKIKSRKGDDSGGS